MTPSRRALSLPLLVLLSAPSLAAEGPPSPARLPPVTEATLSLLEPAGEACEWAAVDALTAERRVLARLEVACQGGATALSPEGSRGAARFWRGGVSSPVMGRPTFPEPFPSPAFRDRLFLVDFTTGGGQELPLPGSGELIEFGFDAEGQLLGLTLQRLSPEQARAGAVEVDGKTLRFDLDFREQPLLTHAFAWKDGAWARREVKVTTPRTGTTELVLRKSLGERSNHLLNPRFTPEAVESDRVLDQLQPLTPEQPEGEWSQLRKASHLLVFWGTPFGDEVLATGLLRRVEKGKAYPLPSLPLQANDLVGLQGRGPFLLVSLADSGGHPRLYRGRKLVWSSESARAVTFWPR